jgi:hypothetical protein
MIEHLFCELHAVRVSFALFICMKEEQQAVIRFLWTEGVLMAEVHKRMPVQ